MENTRYGYIKKDRQERYNYKRGWFVNAYRVVDVDGKDLFQPWCNSKKEAMVTAKELNIVIMGEMK